MTEVIRYGMVGGSTKAFIGDVHRKAINFDPRVKLVAGCFSTSAELNKETGAVYGVPEDRIYADYEEMAKAEAAREDGIDFVSIVTPNRMHFPVAMAFLKAGINVVCEKPLCFTVEEAETLKKTAEEKGLLFGVTHAYTGYTMSKVMREMIADGKIGNIVAVNAEYAQDWLIDELDPTNSSGLNMAVWRTDPNFSGASNCVGDIGSHVENYVGYITGLKIRKLLATTNTFGKQLDLNANIIVEYENGANGAYWCSQVAAGHCNDLVIRIYGDRGSLEWAQENPEVVRYTPKNDAPRLINRGTRAVKEKAASFGRVPSGHPEGLYIAFANLYKEYVNALIAKRNGEDREQYDYPRIDDGVEGVKFIQAVVESARNNSVWVEM